MKTMLGDSISDSSEKMLQRGRGKVSIHAIMVKNEYMQSSTYFFQKISAGLVKLSASPGKQQSP